jgi:hypothetical protein
VRTLITIAILTIAVAAYAGGNPDVYAYVSFDPAGDPGVTSVDPAPYSTVDAYVCLGYIYEGMTTVSFALNNVLAQCPGVMATQAFTNLLPGNLAIGDAFAGGITLASTDCMTMDPVVVGYGSYFYLGGACCIEILDHTQYPRWVVDCADPGQVDLYCLEGHGIVAGGTCLTPTDFPCIVPVEDASWGSIKAMYQ